MSKLLFNRPPLVVDPQLAALIGLYEAIILQQIHYWIELNRENHRNFRDGYYWTYNSYEGWKAQFPFWGTDTIRRTIVSLEKKGLIKSANYNDMGRDRTKWYTILYQALNSLELVSGNGRWNTKNAICEKSTMEHSCTSQDDFYSDQPINRPDWIGFQMEYSTLDRPRKPKPSNGKKAQNSAH